MTDDREVHDTDARLWEIVRSRGLGDYFLSTWVECSDEDEVVRRVTAASAVRCDLQTAMRWYPFGVGDSMEDTLWIGRHHRGWTHVLQISGTYSLHDSMRASLTREGERLLSMVTTDVEGTEDLVLVENGRLVDYLRWADNTPEQPDGLFARNMTGVRFDGPDGTQENAFLEVIGRITGEPLDETWFDGEHTFCRIVPGAW
ncbi:hypothetical protein AB0F88_29520 [Streptosporangium sp. NPDC023963]|uniref:hypothetical protein n=1 Tax=Streptosporangium sp. NPDC023963 TaxID=3155608 RepID=UPI00342CCAC7